MSNPEHLQILRLGISQWNEWRKNNPEIIPDLGGEDFSGLNLSGIDLSNSKLAGADFSASLLLNANFSNAKTGVTRPQKVLRTLSFICPSATFLGFCSYLIIDLFASAALFPEQYSPIYLISIVILTLSFVRTLIVPSSLYSAVITLGTTTLVIIPLNLLDLYQIGSQDLSISRSVTISMFGVFYLFIFSVAFNIFSRLLIRLSIATSQEGKVNEPPLIWESSPSTLASIQGVWLASHGSSYGKFFMAMIVYGFIMNFGKVKLKSALSFNNNENWFYDSTLRNVCDSGTKFNNAELSHSSFRGANLAGSNFSGATLDFVCWLDSLFLDLAIFDDRSMMDLRVRNLLQTGNGEGKDYREAYLRNLNLDGSNLKGATLADANLINCSLKRSDLSNANLARVRATGATFDQCKLTGSYGVRTWKITSQTSFESVQCEYLYLGEIQEDRQPSDRNFKPGEFVALARDSLARERPFRRVSERLVRGDLESNLNKISELIQDFEVQAIFEPFFDNKAVDSLVAMKDVGISFSPELKILTTKKNLEKNFLEKEYFMEKIKSEFKSVEIRFMSSQPSKKEHRRFFLLGDNYSLILGLSLNDLQKDEAASLDVSEYDEVFFREKWNSYSNIVNFPD